MYINCPYEYDFFLNYYYDMYNIITYINLKIKNYTKIIVMYVYHLQIWGFAIKCNLKKMQLLCNYLLCIRHKYDVLKLIANLILFVLGNVFIYSNE